MNHFKKYDTYITYYWWSQNLFRYAIFKRFYLGEKKGVNKILSLCRNENYNGYLKRSFRKKNSRHDVFVYKKQHTWKHGSPMNFNPSPAISHNHDLINSVCAKRG
jgi:hypothetical protein